MSANTVTDTNNQPQQGEQSPRAESSEHGHTGEGAASVLAHLNSQGDKHRRQNRDTEEPSGSGHP